MNLEAVINEYLIKRPLYEKFTKKLEDFFKSKLSEIGLDDPRVRSRTKTVDSFREKITRPAKHYSDPLDQITDLSGVRIIVFYTDQLSTVVEMVKKEFEIDPLQSIDKSSILKPDTFGYRAIHYIIYLNEKKEKLKDWEEFKGLKAEVQIRTNLQDAWATASHTLFYKREGDLPNDQKRKLFRLAGLFELVDEQFLIIKNENIEKLNLLKKQYEEGNTESIQIDMLSIIQFLASSALMREALFIANDYLILGNQDLLGQYNKADCSLVTQECQRLKIKNIQELEIILQNNESGNRLFLKKVSKGRTWKATNAFILLLLIIKAFVDKFEPKYLVEKYGWDYLASKSIIDTAKESQKS